MFPRSLRRAQPLQVFDERVVHLARRWTEPRPATHQCLRRGLADEPVRCSPITPTQRLDDTRTQHEIVKKAISAVMVIETSDERQAEAIATRAFEQALDRVEIHDAYANHPTSRTSSDFQNPAATYRARLFPRSDPDDVGWWSSKAKEFMNWRPFHCRSRRPRLLRTQARRASTSGR
jgi:hypothetical protein